MYYQSSPAKTDKSLEIATFLLFYKHLFWSVYSLFKLNKIILKDAQKVFETLKSPQEIERFQKASYDERTKMVQGLDFHSETSFGYVCLLACEYAQYVNESQKRGGLRDIIQNASTTDKSARKKVEKNSIIQSLIKNCFSRK